MIEWVQTCFICTSVYIYIYIYIGWAKSRYTVILYYIATFGPTCMYMRVYVLICIDIYTCVKRRFVTGFVRYVLLTPFE
jgi:hypothetical protein